MDKDILYFVAMFFTNGVNKTNWKKKYISSCLTLKEAFTAEYNGVLRRTH